MGLYSNATQTVLADRRSLLFTDVRQKNEKSIVSIRNEKRTIDPFPLSL
jgi:hypothetical protein